MRSQSRIGSVDQNIYGVTLQTMMVLSLQLSHVMKCTLKKHIHLINTLYITVLLANHMKME